MRKDLPNGSFWLSWQKITAYYSPNGELLQAEYKLINKFGVQTTRRVAKNHTKVRDWLEKQGQTEVNLILRGIRKRKRPDL